MKYTNKDAKVRLYDGTATPWYFEMCLDSGDFSGPIGTPELDEILVLDRGMVTTCAHYITSNDAPVMEPITLSFSVMINDSAKFLYFMDWIEGNTVNGNTTVTTKGDHPRLGTGMDFADTTKKCYNVEYKLTGTTNNIAYKFNEVYFNLMDQTYSEAEDGVTLSLTGTCYGTIVRASDFTAGSDVTA